MGIKTYVLAFALGVSSQVFAQDIASNTRKANQITDLFFDGLKDKLNENYKSAALSFTKVIALDQNQHAAYFELALAHFRQNNFTEAENAIRNAIKLNGKNVWYLKLATDIYKQTGDMDALVVAFDALIALDADNENYYHDRANALFIAGKTDASLAAYNALEKRFGVSKGSIAAKLRFNKDKKINPTQDLQQLIANEPQDISNYLNLSGLLLQENKSEAALVNLLKAKAIAPTNFEVNMALADVYNDLKRQDEAYAALKQAFLTDEMPLAAKTKVLTQMLTKSKNQNIANQFKELAEITEKLHPQQQKITLLQGDFFYQNNEFEQAAKYYKAAVAQNENTYMAWQKLLAVETLIGNYAGAIKSGEKALTMYPNQVLLYYYLAFALHRKGQTAQADLELKNALTLESDDDNLNAMIYALQAEVFIDQSKFKEADAAFDKAIKLAPTNYLTMSNYAYYLALRNHDLTKAERLAKLAVTALPQDASVLDTYAMVLLKNGNAKAALNYIALAVKNNSNQNHVYLEHYGDILFVNGDRENAILQWQKSKDMGNLSDKLIRKINEKKYIK